MEPPAVFKPAFSGNERSIVIFDPAGGGVVPGSTVSSLEQLWSADGTTKSTVPPSKNF
ncbi:MAG: hypothetical protein MZV63_36360 [Marinilabiliales bacterium]|nr:hypothetical protein [Marinilabiliales bacterium]